MNEERQGIMMPWERNGKVYVNIIARSTKNGKFQVFQRVNFISAIFPLSSYSFCHYFGEQSSSSINPSIN